MEGRVSEFTEIFGNSAIDPIPIGYRVGDFVIGLRVDGRDQQSGQLGNTIEEQLELAFENMRNCVQAAGGTVDNVGQVSFFLADFEHRPLINSPWVEMFPDESDRPTYKFMPATLSEGQLVQIELYAVLGESRHDVHIAGVAHTNPIPMAVRMGRYLFSSRILPYDPETGRPAEEAQTQATHVFGNASTVLETAAFMWSDVVQGRAFLVDPSDSELMAAHWAAKFPEVATRPPLHMVQYGTGGLLVMLELIAMAKR